MNQPISSSWTRNLNSWLGLFAVAFAYALDNSEGGLVKNLFPVMQKSLNMDYLMLGVMTAIGSIARALFAPIWGWLADRFGRKRILFVVTGLWGVWTLLSAFSPTSLALLILYGISAAGTVGAEPVSLSITADLFPPRDHGRAFGVMRGIQAVLLVGFIPLAGFLATLPEGWRWALGVLGVLSMSGGIIVLTLLPESHNTPRQGTSQAPLGRQEWLGLARVPTIWLLALSLPLVTSLIFFNFGVSYLVNDRHLDIGQATTVFAFFAVGYVVSSAAGGLLGDWFEGLWPRRGRILLMQLYLGTYALMSWLALTVVHSSWEWYVPLYFGFGLVSAFGFSGAVYPMASAVVPEKHRSAVFGLLFAFVQGGAVALSSLWAGSLADRSSLAQVLPWFVSLPYALNLLLWFLFYATFPRDAKEAP